MSTDMLPFTHEAFIEVFRAYNVAIWPTQIVAYGLGAIAVFLLLRSGPRSSRAILGILALMWAWTGIAYHMVFFSAINPVAYLFGGLFILQSALLSWSALSGRTIFGLRGGVAGIFGIGMIAYALLLYPAIGTLVGQSYPSVPVFGVAPCPLVIFTFGLLLLAKPAPFVLLVIPALWSLVGGSARVPAPRPAGLAPARQRAAGGGSAHDRTSTARRADLTGYRHTDMRSCLAHPTLGDRIVRWTRAQSTEPTPRSSSG